jgi:hypothetical protein
LREIVAANLVVEGLRIAAGSDRSASALELEYRPIEASEVVIRTMLTASMEKGGLSGRLPLTAPRQAAVAAQSPDGDPVIRGDNPEFAAGARRVAHFAALASQGRRLENEKGAQRVAEFAELEARRETK